ncbi:MAG: TIGR00341 family protein [Betaproteobacteria bacterium]
MHDPQLNFDKSPARRVRAAITERFSLRRDKADDEEIEKRIRDGVDLSGATPWILMFAIVVASVGLNINSTAVIIGAMLISPIMGPIMGAGLGIAVFDFDLVKRSLKNLGIATLISLAVSALYFAISPLREAQSELLARTTPTIWDVLIAIFGGLAGVIGLTRTNRSNIIPGVAIATALMPPVCTAGYGIATGQWHFFGGALYLYLINCVFIALATFIGLRVLKLKRHGFADERVERRVKFSLSALALVTALPSAYLATNLVKDELFRSRAKIFVGQEFSLPYTHVAETKIDPDQRIIELSLIGAPVNVETLRIIESRLAMQQLEGAKIIVHQIGDNKVDVTALKASLLSDLYRDSQEVVQKKDDEIQKMRKELLARKTQDANAVDIANELRAQQTDVTGVFVGEGVEVAADGGKRSMLALNVSSKRPLSKGDRLRIENWFKVRLKTDAVVLNFYVERRVRKT